MDDVTGIDQAQTDAAGNGRRDMAIGKLHSGVVDLALIVLDDTLILMDRRHLGIELLFGNCILAVSGLVTIQIDVRVLK